MELRSGAKEYNQKLISTGNIKFGTPQKWADNGEKYGDGRGDKYEGTFATCHVADIEHLSELMVKYNIPNDSLIMKCYDNRWYFKNVQSMRLPTFCLYGLSYDIFEIKPEPGWQRIKGTIPGKYFHSFAVLDGADVSELPDEKQPSIVMIENIDEFQRRLYKRLNEIGINSEDIIASPVLYYDFQTYGPDGWLDFGDKFPKELFIKDKSFDYQSEIRFVINTTDEEIIDYLHNNAIDIGSLDDIAQYVDGYYRDGIGVEMSINISTED